MGYYYDGYYDAMNEVNNMTEDELLVYIDGLYGRDNLPQDYTIHELRSEAIRQVKEDFIDRSSPEYEQAQFWKKVGKLMRSNR